MPVLKNPRHELFALGIVQGKSGRAAYHAAGYKAKDATADASASVLIRNHKVAERIAELQNRVSERAEVKIVEVVGTLATVLRANSAPSWNF